MHRKPGRAILGFAVLSTALFLPSLRSADAPPTTPSVAAEVRPRETKLPALPAAFKHPGLLNSKEGLDFVKGKIAAGEEPWKSAFEQMKASPWAALDFKPHAPRTTISSGFLGKGGEEGGVAGASMDAKAAYTQSLMWVFTGDERYARNAAALLNNWSVLRENRGGNWYLQASWLATMFTNAAEIIRHTWPEWKREDIARFSEMLNEAFLPIFHNRPAYGNRLFSVGEAMMSIGVFNEDRAAFTEGLHRWVSYVPCWIYLQSDGPDPVRPDYWLTRPTNEELAALDANLFPDVKKSWIFREKEVVDMMKANKLGDDSTIYKTASNLDKGGMHWNKAPDAAYVDGLSAETYRDLGHCDLGFASVVNSAEIAWNQGIDLYGLEARRLTAFMELHAGLRIDEVIPPVFYRVRGTPVQSGAEAAYNHYHNIKGRDLPKTRAFMEKVIRPCLRKEINGAPGWSWVPVDPGVRAENIVWPIGCNVAWETLTHAGTGESK
ncbi:MAG: alginate lyase family protein [Opitutaceae bacterium]